jgi:hypothetical protein
LRQTLLNGALIGLSGGLAEIAFVWIYMRAGERDPAIIAWAIAEALHLGASAAAGIAIHMMLSLLLGIGLMATWLSVRGVQPKPSAAYLFMAAALTVVWSFNFLVLLPSLNPAFAILLPYPVSFAATLLFALAGAPVLQRLESSRAVVFLRPPKIEI